MYLTFYGFKEKPFSLLPDPDYLYLSSTHRAALSHLDYGLMEQTGFIVITGDMGTGKTILLKHLIRKLDESVQVALVFNTSVSSLQLLQMILREYDLDEREKSKSRCYVELYAYFLDEYSRGNRCLLIIDEAQNLSPTGMEEIRMLSNLNAGKDNLLQIILAGQPALKLKLERKAMRQFAQRITMDFILEPLGEDETREYIVHRMSVAGRDSGDNLFTPESYHRIYRGSGGIPRLINILCDRALTYGFADELNAIDVCVIDEVMGDKKIKGQFYDTGQAREDALTDPSAGTLSRKLNDVSQRLGNLERQFNEFQDQRNDQTIQRLEKLLSEERERLQRATYECAEKGVTIKILRQRIEQLTKSCGIKESGPEH